jgi:hypothetical protein
MSGANFLGVLSTHLAGNCPVSSSIQSIGLISSFLKSIPDSVVASLSVTLVKIDSRIDGVVMFTNG